MTVFALMTALPPTIGHRAMIEFAARWAKVEGNQEVDIIVHTQPDEPMCRERVMAIRTACENIAHEVGMAKEMITVVEFHRQTKQDPATPGFREYWGQVMAGFGFETGDTLVCAESYGKWLAEMVKGKFIPYDPQREIVKVKATPLREEDGLVNHFSDMMPEFQPYMQATITVFGAESTGKTTFSRELAALSDSYWVHEYARPLLESTSPDLDKQVMLNIMRGQYAMQTMVDAKRDKPFTIQDTDLYSTVGYWKLPAWKNVFGEVPEELEELARKAKSDLYIILKSDIPFEHDAIRYGGDERESDDQYWIDIAEEYGLDYIVMDETDPGRRVGEGLLILKKMLQDKQDMITYDRGGF